jgi:uncharacterized protein
MQLSRHNIVTPIEGTDRSLIVNLLSGHADVIDRQHAERLTNGGWEGDAELVAKGYVVDPDDEAKRYRQAYLDFLKNRDADEIQIFYVPTYACNFDCSYCYQKSYETPPAKEQDDVLSAFFAYVDRAFAERRKYVTLFGGEPLLATPASERVVARIVDETSRRGLDLAVVTNGFHLERYVDLLSKARIREIQVTLDGTAKVHDKRRHLAGGKPTFDAIARGIDAALAGGLAINLRSVVDRDNIDAFVDLAHFAIDRGWADNPKLKTQIGRNYELHECQTGRSRLFDRLEIYKEIFARAQRDPALLRYHRPAFSVARFLLDNGELPSPLFDACPGTKTEWAFDYTGHIYSCTATVGKPGEALGTFHPEVRLQDEQVARWEDRDVLAIEPCRTCSLQLACGGGCGAVAKNRAGTVAAPDCRPVRELLSLGTALYAPDDALSP